MRLPEDIRRLFRLGLVRPQVSRDIDNEHPSYPRTLDTRVPTGHVT